MVHDLANDDGYVALKWAAEDREGWTQRKDVKNLLYSRRLLIMMSFLSPNQQCQSSEWK